MEQLFLFGQSPEPSPSLLDVTYWKLNVDGASKNNPGPSGAGIYLLKNDLPFEASGFYLGNKTNNQAEYLALLIGLFYVKKHIKKGDPILIQSDSQLLVRQLQGRYKVNHPELRPLHAAARAEIADLNVTIAHVLREDNTDADALANEGVETKKMVSAQIKKWLQAHAVQL
jgi:ribonuclease HI